MIGPRIALAGEYPINPLAAQRLGADGARPHHPSVERRNHQK